MRYPAEQTAERHERILDAAARLVRERGLDGASVSEVMKAAGLTHGAFYAHFDSKEAMATAALGRALDEMLALVDQAGEAADPLLAFSSPYLTTHHRDNLGQGCAMAALGPEVGRGSDEVRRAFTSRVSALVDRLSGGSSERERRRDRASAIGALSTLVGAMVLARAVDDPILSDEILASARTQLALPPNA